MLRIISSSPNELQPIFDALLANATRLCEASYGTLWLHGNDGQMRMAALHGSLPAGFREQWRVGTSFHPSPAVPTARVFHTRKPVQVVDLKEDEAYVARDPLAVASVEVGGIRSLIAIPVLKDGATLGALTIYRREVRPFTGKHIQLVTNFAAQAVIAIENARLLNELRQRTADLTELFEQQTATSEVLRVVSSSLGDLQPVFDAMLANATKICAAKFGVLWLSEGEQFRCVALHNAPSAFADQYKGQPVVHPARGTGLRQLLDTRKVTQVADMTTIRPYIERDPFVVKSVESGGYRSVVNVPMLKENELVGAISIYHREVRPFTERQIELVSNFANQAVIAIENARLLNELRQSLEEQTATSDVLRVISSSLGDLEPVFAAMLEKAVRICDAKFGNIYRWDGEALHLAASHNTPPAFAAARRRSPQRGGAAGIIGRMLATKTLIHISPI